MDIFDIDIDDEPREISKMNQIEFNNRTKKLLNNICDIYLHGWKSILLKDIEYPDENTCDKCNGCGLFMYNNEQKECFQDRELGDCFHRVCDYEQIVKDFENHLDEVYELISVEEIVNIE